DDLRSIDALRQESNPRIDLAQTALAVLVVGVLAAVAVTGSPGYDLRHGRPLPVQQEPVLVLQPLQSGRRDVVLRLRSGRVAHRFSQGPFPSHWSFRGASPLGLPCTRSRSPLRRLPPSAWLARDARSRCNLRRTGQPTTPAAVVSQRPSRDLVPIPTPQEI